MTTGTDIATKVRNHVPKLTRAEKQANRETVQRRAGLLEERAFQELGKLLSDRKTPANAKTRAVEVVLDRIAGKPKQDPSDARPEHEMDRMSQAQLLTFVCETIMGLSKESQSLIAEALLCSQRGEAFDPRLIDPDYDETRALAAERPELPPLEREPKKVKIPRR